MGRPTKATEARVEVYLNALRLGVSREAAAAYAEINRTTALRWMGTKPGFRAQVEKAEADAQVRLVGQIAQAASKDWRAASDLLGLIERRAERAAARQVRASADVPAAPAPHPLDGLSPLEQAQREAAWAATLGTEAAARVAAASPGGPA